MSDETGVPSVALVAVVVRLRQEHVVEHDRWWFRTWFTVEAPGDGVRGDRVNVQDQAVRLALEQPCVRKLL